MLLWIINELSEMQLDILAMMIQLKVGGKTHEILEEQAIGSCKTGLSPLPYMALASLIKTEYPV